nr:hypothetical protein Iba_chr12eCG17060 [Ipomoea batatas]
MKPMEERDFPISKEENLKGKINDMNEQQGGGGFMKPMNERDYQVPLNAGASTSGTKPGDAGQRQEADPVRKQNGIAECRQPVCGNVNVVNEKDKRYAQSRLANENLGKEKEKGIVHEPAGVDVNRGNKGRMQNVQGNQWNMGKKVTTLFNVDARQEKGNPMPSTSEIGKKGGNQGAAQKGQPSANNGFFGERVVKSEGGGDKVQNAYEGGKREQNEGYVSEKEKYEYARGKGMSYRGRGGREGFRGGRGGAMGRGQSMNPGAVPYEPRGGEKAEKTNDCEQKNKTQKNLFSEKHPEGEGEREKQDLEKRGGKGGKGKRNTREEGEIRDSAESDGDYTASIDESEDEEEHERVLEVEKEEERRQMGVNATPTKLTKAQKRKMRKKKSSGRKAGAPDGGGGVCY